MMHESLKIKEMVIKESEGFRLTIRAWEVLSPKGLYNYDFIQDALDEHGKVKYTSTYNFHMTKEEVQKLCEGLLSV